MDRNLAMLAAQYEKTSQEPGQEVELSPGHLMVNTRGERLDRSTETLDTLLMPPAMAILNNSSDTVKLARELRHKRDQLEELMKKNVFPSSVNESASGSARVKDSNRSGVSQETLANPGQQLSRLQDQVNKLKQELDRLSQPSDVPPPEPPQPPVTRAVSEAQLSQLSVSINQLYSGLWSLQREVSLLSGRVASMEHRPESGARRDSLASSRAGNTEDLWPHQNNYNISDSNTPIDRSAPQASEWAHPSASLSGGPLLQPPAWDPHHHFSPYPSRELWNSLQASPGFNNPLHLGVGLYPPNFHISETDSGVSSGALNNQVSPGMRANNYYDNFRSYSRQNRLSAPQGPPLTSSGVPLSVNSVLQHQSNVEQNNVNNGGTRPRRKHKINREQNRDSSNRASEQSNLRRRTEGANPVQAANTYNSPTTDTTTDSLTHNIYSQVGALIQQNDRAPELLARLLQDLTLLGQHQDSAMVNMNIDTVDTSSFTSEGTRDSDLTTPQVRRSSQSRSKVAGKRLTSEPQSVFSAPSASSASFDNDSSNILTGAGALWSQPWASGAASNSGVAVPKNQQKNLISRERDNISRKMPSWRERLLPRNMQGHDPEGSGLDHDRGFINIQLELPEDSQPDAAEAGPGGHERQDSVVSASVSGHHSHSLSDMAETEDLAEADQSHEIGGHMYTSSGGRDLWAREVGETRDISMEVREQFMSPTQNPNRESSYLPEGVFPVRDSGGESAGVQINVTVAATSEVSGDHNNQNHHGLDRVPIRLQPVSNVSSQAGGWAGLGQAATERVEARRLEEEKEAVASILEEVLASSPELANSHEANNPPSP